MKTYLIATAFLTIGFLFAEDEDVSIVSRTNTEVAIEQPKAPAKAPKTLNSRLQIGGNYTYATIKPQDETISQGNLGGMQGLYEYRPKDRFYGAAKLVWRQGGTKGSDENRSLLDIKLEERLGYTASFDSGLFTLFSGIGYRHLRQHIHPSNQPASAFNGSFFPPFLTDSTSLLLKYQEFYVPVGFLSDYTFNSWFAFGFYFTWMPQIYQTVDIKPLGDAFWWITNQWANILVEVPFCFTLTKDKHCTLIIKPFYEYWQDGHSTAATSTGIPLGLPGNTYNFGGVELNFLYAF